jgi:hypothetical protein
VKVRLLSLAAVLGALGTALCCLAPIVFPLLGASTLVSLTALCWVAPYRTAFFTITLVALALAVATAVIRRGRLAPVEWGILGGSAIVVAGLLAYSLRVEGLPGLP